jgi:hypothetical protein
MLAGINARFFVQTGRESRRAAGFAQTGEPSEAMPNGTGANVPLGTGTGTAAGAGDSICAAAAGEGA